ncbi:MAG: hypothetical protein R6X32_08965 [Chloroflexota bacterium]
MPNDQSCSQHYMKKPFFTAFLIGVLIFMVLYGIALVNVYNLSQDVLDLILNTDLTLPGLLSGGLYAVWHYHNNPNNFNALKGSALVGNRYTRNWAPNSWHYWFIYTTPSSKGAYSHIGHK